jgi:hypothetical protein
VLLATKITVGRIRMVISMTATSAMMRVRLGRRISGLAVFKFHVRPAVVVSYPD